MWLPMLACWRIKDSVSASDGLPLSRHCQATGRPIRGKVIMQKIACAALPRFLQAYSSWAVATEQGVAGMAGSSPCRVVCKATRSCLLASYLAKAHIGK